MSRIITGHQPVYLPWIGLFHKISLTDIFIFMDDVQYLAQDWNNRNKIKTPHGWMWLIVPVSIRSSKSLLLKDIFIDNSKKGTKDDWQVRHWKAISFNYKRALYFNAYADFFYDMYMNKQWEKLSDLNEYQLRYFLEILGIKVDFYKASDLNFTKKGSDLVLEHCRRFNADICVTGCHGKDYIREDDFKKIGINVYYQDYVHPEYNQLWGNFLTNISVVDLLFNYGNTSFNILSGNNVTRQELEGRSKELQKR